MHKLEQKGLLPEQMLAELPAFMAKIERLAEQLGLSLAGYQADHIALRVNDWETAEQLHQAWLAYGKEWSTNEINGRPIVVIGFDKPLSCAHGRLKHWSCLTRETKLPTGGVGAR